MELTELQKQLRATEEQIIALKIEIDKEQNKYVNENEINYNKIRRMAKRYKFGKHPIGEIIDLHIAKKYILSLLNLVHLSKDSECMINRMIFVQWVLYQSKLNIELQELFRESLRIEPKLFEDLDEILPEMYHSQLIVDTLLVANICGKCNSEELLYIVNLSEILEIEKEELRILSLISNGILKQDLSMIKMKDYKNIQMQKELFMHYLEPLLSKNELWNKKTIKRNILSNNRNHDDENDTLKDKYNEGKVAITRNICVEAHEYMYRNFEWKVKQGSKVCSADVIATYTSQWGNRTFEIKSSGTGILYQFKIGLVNYGVVSVDGDSIEKIKDWIYERDNT